MRSQDFRNSIALALFAGLTAPLFQGLAAIERRQARMRDSVIAALGPFTGVEIYQVLQELPYGTGARQLAELLRWVPPQLWPRQPASRRHRALGRLRRALHGICAPMIVQALQQAAKAGHEGAAKVLRVAAQVDPSRWLVLIGILPPRETIRSAGL